MLNIFIGPNSEGKTNLANALRLICGYDPDFGTDPELLEKNIRKTFEPNDFYDKTQSIEIEAVSDSHEKPITLKISPEQIGENTQRDQSLKNEFFPVGANKEIFKIGIKEVNNWDILQENWNELRYEMKDCFQISLQKEPPQNKDFILSDIQDENGQLFYEAGSGRTSVLYYLIEIKINYSKGVRSFLFDEPEIHMHPSLLRQFLKYLNLLTERNIQFFITTHSSILIDHSILSDNAVVFQIKKKNSYSKITNISKNRIGLRDVLYNQLGYKPSDILLVNTVIWVEGPSDMIYLRQWLNERAPELEEGKDFTIMFYGGNLITHLSFEEDIDVDGLIDLSSINVNSAIMMDSDIKNARDKIGPNKERVKKSFEDHDRFVWITKGREVENYIQQSLLKQAVKKIHPNDINKYKIQPDPDKYGQRTFLKENPTNKKKIYIRKVKVAKQVVKIQEEKVLPTNFTILDLGKKLDKLINWIKKI